jgi:nicotinamide-nucleotide amidase
VFVRLTGPYSSDKPGIADGIILSSACVVKISFSAGMYTKDDVAGIGKFLLRAKETVAVAESVTSGHIQAALSMADLAQQFFQGGITVYNVAQKFKHLNVEPIHALSCNAVSKQVAIQLASGVAMKFSSSWGIGICGYAAPVPELQVDKPYAFFAITEGEKVRVSRKIGTSATNGRPTQEYYVQAVLNAFESLLQKRRRG